jgi:hypothetical protein
MRETYAPYAEGNKSYPAFDFVHRHRRDMADRVGRGCPYVLIGKMAVYPVRRPSKLGGHCRLAERGWRACFEKDSVDRRYQENANSLPLFEQILDLHPKSARDF